MPNADDAKPDIDLALTVAWDNLREAKQKRSVLSGLAELLRAERIANGFDLRIRAKLEGQ